MMKLKRTLGAVLVAAATAVGSGAWAQDLPGFSSWDEVVEKAKGQTVYWYMWGGSDAINGFVDEFYGKPLKEQYDITLNRVPLADTVDAVNQVISEKEAGATGDKGTIDMIWINGENFFTLRQADLLYGPWAEGTPNSALVDWSNPAVNLDFGRPVDGYESPWSSAQFHFVYDSARLKEEDLPRSYAALGSWIEANPGRFTYMAPGPGAFVGTRFVKQLFFELSGGHDQWVGPFNQELYDKWAPEVWKTLLAWKPNLWREGETYPAGNAELRELFANGEVEFDFTQSPSGAAPNINAGLIPPTSRAFAFDANLIGDFNYLAIPFNAPNKAAALVTANLVLRPDRQAAQVQPANGFCCGWGIDVNKVTDPAGKEAIAVAMQNLGDAAADPNRLAAALVSDIAAEYQSKIEADWQKYVLRGEPLPN
ncbi:MAG: ABC transporter substrate-binding protein [Alphaproteobacteria bacterium]|nr:ABC transporter substrate-binding protein [Alphaproteobacteria bacterium]